jgi:DNA-binding transcriptional MerR regulator
MTTNDHLGQNSGDNRAEPVAAATGSVPESGGPETVGIADGKEPDALRTIGEVAKALDIRQHVLRYWEEQFPMLRPLKRSGGRRYYRPEDIRLVETIDRLVHREGYTLKGAKQVLQGGGTKAAKASAAAAAPVAPKPAQLPDAAIVQRADPAHRARLIAIRTTLAAALHES